MSAEAPEEGASVEAEADPVPGMENGVAESAENFQVNSNQGYPSEPAKDAEVLPAGMVVKVTLILRKSDDS